MGIIQKTIFFIQMMYSWDYSKNNIFYTNDVFMRA